MSNKLTILLNKGEVLNVSGKKNFETIDITECFNKEIVLPESNGFDPWDAAYICKLVDTSKYDGILYAVVEDDGGDTYEIEIDRIKDQLVK